MHEISLATELQNIAGSALWAFATALCVAVLILAAMRTGAPAARGRWLFGAQRVGPQHLHDSTVPRLGGVAIVAGFGVGLLHLVGFGSTPPAVSAATASLILAALLLVAGCGLLEDLTGQVPPRQRLLVTALATVVLVVAGHLELDRVGLPMLDPLLGWWPFAVGLTVFVIVGATNAYNIVDGLDGLLAGVSLITLAVIAWVAMSVGDGTVFALAALLGMAALGWLPFNWPRARMHAGDAGAYAIGFLTAVFLLMLVDRNPGVSAWFGVTAAALPVCETVYSMWRRARQGRSTLQPDRAHLHQLVQLRVEQAAARHARSAPAIVPNGRCSPLLWALHAVIAVAGAAVHDDTEALLSLLVAFALVYVLVYRVLSRAHGLRTAGVATPRPADLPAPPTAGSRV